SQAKSSHAVDVVRKWSLPAAAVMALGIASVFVVTKLNEPSGPPIPKVTTESVLAPGASKQAVAPTTSAKDVPVASQTSPAIPPKPDVTTPVGAARVAEGAATSDLTQPATMPAAVAAKTNAKIKPRTDAAPAVALT